MDMVAMEDTATARGLLLPMPTMVATDMVATEDTATARDLLMPMLTMVATDMVATEDTATARGPLMPTMVATDMAGNFKITKRPYISKNLNPGSHSVHKLLS